MFDYFVGELRCPRCATTNDAPTRTSLQTHIRGSHSDGSQLAAGFLFDSVQLTPWHLADAGYAIISPPDDTMSPRLLDVWSCHRCRTEQWAAIEIVKQRVEAITAVVLNKASLAVSNYIDDTNGEIEAAALAGISWAEFSDRKLSLVEVLRQRLD